MEASSTRPNIEVSHGPRTGLCQNDRRNGPGGGLASGDFSGDLGRRFTGGPPQRLRDETVVLAERGRISRRQSWPVGDDRAEPVGDDRVRGTAPEARDRGLIG